MGLIAFVDSSYRQAAEEINVGKLIFAVMDAGTRLR
jgi:hypothetical protein